MRNMLLFLGLCLCSTIAMAQLRGGLLPIDQAYKVSADIKAPGIIAVHFAIAPNYYLYRGRMKFTGGKGTTLGEAQLPAGEKRHDEFLGDVVVYHKSVDVTLPYTLATGVNRIRLSVRYQGCHEVEPKLCYPPHTATFDLSTPAPVAVSSRAAAGLTTSSTALDNELRSSAESSKATPAYEGTPAARAALVAGDAAEKKGDITEAIVNYKKAIALDPDFVEAHTQYIFYRQEAPYIQSLRVSRKKLTEDETKKQENEAKQNKRTLIHEYENLATRNPKKAVYPYVLAQFYMESDISKSQRYCGQAVGIDPRFAQGFECLAEIALIRSDKAKASALAHKAMQLDPDNADLATTYLGMLEDNPAAFQIEAKQLIRNFPHSNAIFYMLYDAISRQEPTLDRIAALERLRSDLPAEGVETSELVDEDLFRYYVGTNPGKAFVIAQEALKARAKDHSSAKQWKERVAYVHALLRAKSQVDAGQADAALKTLASVRDLKGNETANAWYLLRAQALAADGRTAEAVNLLSHDFGEHPSDAVLHALIQYGAKLGKTRDEVYDEVWMALKSKAKPAPDFTLDSFDTGRPLSLSDYKGKVVIIDFWYPECGPCLASFPYLQRVAARFKNEGVTVLAINSVKDQEQLVQPLLKSHGYSFLALKGNLKFVQSAYGVQSFPSTFIIGADGNIYFRPFIYDDAREHAAEAAIKFLLTRASKE